MTYLLLLVNAEGGATTSPLAIRQLREFPGNDGLSVHFRPVRNDLLFESAKFAGRLAYRILSGEGVVRSQLWVEYEVPGAHINVTGRSSDLLFALALITSKWKLPNTVCPLIAATGVLDAEGRVHSVERAPEKIAAAVREFESTDRAVIFYPAADAAAVDVWRATSEVPAHIELQPVAHIEEALAYLGYNLEKVYLRNPFRGLEHFDYEHHSIFFGRDREIREVVKQLLRREAAGVPGLLVEGASGSGKSSFLRAGVLPALVDLRLQADEVQHAISRCPFALGVRHAIWRPGLLPSSADEAQIASSIRTCWAALTEIRSTIESNEVQTLAALARQRREYWPKTRRFVWLIDQFEELFDTRLALATQTIDAFGQFLKQLQVDGVWTLASMRADAVPTLKECESLRDIFGANEGQYYLATLIGPALDDVINSPAKAADLTFGPSPDGKRLDQLLREDAYREKDSLPPLQFTLNELYQKRSGKELTFAAYQQLGGLAGSIAATAEAILKNEAAESQRTAPRLFRSLVSVDDFGRATRRYAAMAEIAEDIAQARLAARLVEARLCVTDQRDGQSVVAFAHDTLLRTLPALQEWLRQEAGLLQTRELAQRETRLWQQHDQSGDWLATPDKLLAYQALESAEIFLPKPVCHFIERSRHRVRRTTRIKQAAVAVIASLAVVASIAGWIATKKQHEAEFQAARTLEAQTRLLTETASDHLKDGNLVYAQSIILEVLARAKSLNELDPAAINVFQEIRANDPQIAILSGHRGAVRRAAYSPDGTRIVTTGQDRTARIWDSRTGIQLAVLSAGDKHWVMCADYSPDGTHILTASDNIRIWNAHTGKLISTVHDEEDGFSTAYYSPDGKNFVTASGEVGIWDAQTGKRLQTLKVNDRHLYSATYSPDGTRIVSVSDDRKARIFDARTGAQLQVLSGHNDDLISAVYSPDGTRVLTASTDSTARIWDARSGASLAVLTGVGQMWSAAYSPDGATIVTVSTDRTARIWDAVTGSQLRVLSGHQAILSSGIYSPDGTRILTTAYDGTARIWDARVGPKTIVLSGHTDRLSEVAYAPDGKRIITASEDKTSRIWDAVTGAQLSIITGHSGAVSSARYSPDGDRIITAADDDVRIWDARTTAQVDSLSNSSHGFQDASYSRDGLRIVTSQEDLTARIWDAHTSAELLVLKGHGDYINAVMFSPDGSRVLTASVDKSVRIWDTRTGKQIAILPHPDHLNSAGYSPDGSRIVTGCNDKLVRVWDARSGALVLVLAGHRGFIFASAFSPDGRRIVTGARDNTVRIWDARTGTQLAVLPGHTARVVSVTYSPDGTHIASASVDHTARIWDAAVPADVPTQIIWEKAASSDPMSEFERRQLGLSISTKEVVGKVTPCDLAAAAEYDPDRLGAGIVQANINADIAVSACDRPETSPHRDPRRWYQLGRALVAKKDFNRARNVFELAIAEGYRAARIDLANLLTDETAGMLDYAEAMSLYQQAWESGVLIAAFKRGKLIEHLASNETRGSSAEAADTSESAWFWYQKGANAGEPNALGRWAEEKELLAVQQISSKEGSAYLLHAFGYYAAAAERANKEGWPDAAWRQWRYRRATLARVLAREGMMQQVADVYGEVRDGKNLSSPTFGETLGGLTHSVQ